MTGSWSKASPTKDGLYYAFDPVCEHDQPMVAQVKNYGIMGIEVWFLGDGSPMSMGFDVMRDYLWWSEPIPVPPRPEAT